MRKPWDTLSPAYRRRLERKGITERAHKSGASLHKARGHVSRQHERDSAEIYRLAERNSVPKADVRTALKSHSRDEVLTLLRRQSNSIKGYDKGKHGQGNYRDDYDMDEWPDSFFHYHGKFS